MMRKFILLFLVLTTILSCVPQKTLNEKQSRSVETMKTWYVAPYQVNCTGVGPQKCLLVKHSIDAPWQYFYSSIEGFEFEPGYTYILKIKETPIDNPPADASSIHYQLTNVVNKQKVNQSITSLYDIWGIVKVNGEDLLSQGIAQTLEINTNNMTIMGNAACNSYQGIIKTNNSNNQISFSNVLSTMSYCPKQKQEDAYLKALQSVDTYFRYNQHLLLISNGKIVIEARRMD